jgi:hypothetical protein
MGIKREELMVSLTVSPARARELLQSIRHAHCQQAVDRRWRVDAEGRVWPQSLLWLFCWAETGQGSLTAAADARSVFDEIFDQSFDEVSRTISLLYARLRRYSKEDISEEFSEVLAGRRRNFLASLEEPSVSEDDF